MKKPEKYQGIPREKIPWNPKIDKKKCTACGTCVDFCQHGVYSLGDDCAVVSNPFSCIVGCTGCLNKCPEGAISFPDTKEFVEILRKIRAEQSGSKGRMPGAIG